MGSTAEPAAEPGASSTRPRRSAGLICAGLLALVQVAAAQSPTDSAPRVVVGPPPEGFFAWVEEKDREAARSFYKKHLEVGGLPVAASAEVADLALLRTHEIVSHLLAGRPDVLEAMAKNRMYLIIIGKDQVYTDMPEYRDHPNPKFQNERVRGTGGRPTSFGEENLLSLPLDRYDDESIAVHEFCHTIDGTLRSLDPAWPARLRKVYQGAIDRGLWRDAYAAGNPGEYWAEVCQSYFDCNRINNWNHGPIRTREQLRAYDPEGHELVRGAFRLTPSTDWRYTWVQPLPNVGPPPARLELDPYYKKFTWARELPVLGTKASDASLLAANDLIRKLFAYRHDILKSLIAEGIRVVVLGREERLSDLPEIKALPPDSGVDLVARSLPYSRATRLIVVPEESLERGTGTSLDPEPILLRELARSIPLVPARRPVDPHFEARGRELQQYELRVRRIDQEFERRLGELHAAALTRDTWKGTAAVQGPVEYWAEGVLAYFDAAGERPAPPGAPAPIVTREALRVHDADLFALVEETFAYRGKVDWRYRRAR